MTGGFVKLPRGYFENGFWEEERTFSRSEALLDMIANARWKEGHKVVGGKRIAVPCGGFVASERYLSLRWKWSRSKVRKFLSVLRDDGELDQRRDQGETILILAAVRDSGDCRPRKEPPHEPPHEPPGDRRETRDVPKKKTGIWEEGEKEDDLSLPTVGYAGLPDVPRESWGGRSIAWLAERIDRLYQPFADTPDWSSSELQHVILERGAFFAALSVDDWRTLRWMFRQGELGRLEVTSRRTFLLNNGSDQIIRAKAELGRSGECADHIQPASLKNG